MKEFIEWSAWTMEKPAIGSGMHFLFLFIGFALAIAGAILLRKMGKKGNNILLFCVGITLFFLELYDQFFLCYMRDGGVYRGWRIPFQLCDVPIYMCLILCFMPECKLKEWTYQFLGCYSLFSGFISVIVCTGVSFEYITLTFNGFVSHHLLVFIGLYLVVSGRACRKISDFVPAVIIYFGLVGIAQLLNVIFQEHMPALFYISPFKPTTIPVFDKIEEAIGWFGNMWLYTVSISIAAFLVLLAAVYLRKLCQHLYNKKKANKQ